MPEVVKATGNRSAGRLGELDKEIKELSLKIEDWKKAVEKGIELDNAVTIINRDVFQRGQLYQEKNSCLAKVTEAIVTR